MLQGSPKHTYVIDLNLDIIYSADAYRSIDRLIEHFTLRHTFIIIDLNLTWTSRGSHIHVTCRNICDRDQKWNQAINVLFRSRSRDQDEF